MDTSSASLSSMVSRGLEGLFIKYKIYPAPIARPITNTINILRIKDI